MCPFLTQACDCSRFAARFRSAKRSDFRRIKHRDLTVRCGSRQRQVQNTHQNAGKSSGLTLLHSTQHVRRRRLAGVRSGHPANRNRTTTGITATPSCHCPQIAQVLFCPYLTLLVQRPSFFMASTEFPLRRLPCRQAERKLLGLWATERYNNPPIVPNVQNQPSARTALSRWPSRGRREARLSGCLLETRFLSVCLIPFLECGLCGWIF
jgi:hypothetical protein